MTPDHLITASACFALVWTLGATLAVITHHRPLSFRSILYALVAYVMLCLTVWVDSHVSLGRNAAMHLLYVITSGDPEYLCAAALGVCLGVGPAIWPWQSSWASRPQGWLERTLRCAGLSSIVCALLFIALFALRDKLKPYLVHRGFANIVVNPVGFDTPPAYRLEEFHQCHFHPTQIAVGPDGSLYATGYQGDALQDGLVVRLQRDSRGNIRETIVAKHLGRPHGLAFFNGDLYVSRSGQHGRAESGVMRWVNTGAVTLLRDLNGDGVADYYDDIVSGLPGAQGPDPLHQNNGIAFSPDGFLYTTVGIPVDRGPAVSELEGTIIRCRADGSEMCVFARGFRNPFDVVIGPDGQVFATDNDANDRRSGDELNHIIENGHYGFPYADGASPHPEGAIEPIAVLKRGTLQGLAYVPSTSAASDLRNCLLVVSYENGEMFRVTLSQRNGTYTAELEFFARLTGAVDVEVDQNGAIYVSCFHTRKIFRLTRRGQRS